MFGLVIDFCRGMRDFPIVVLEGGEVDFGKAVLLTGGGDGPFMRAVVCLV